MFGYFIEVSVIGIGMVFNMKFYCIRFFIFKKFEYYNALQNNSGLVDYQVRSWTVEIWPDRAVVAVVAAAVVVS